MAVKMAKDKQWIPLYYGIADRKHFRRMGSAIALYIFYLTHCGRETGELSWKFKRIAKEMGIGERTARRWHKRLRKWKYIEDKRMPRCLITKLTNWRPLPDFRKIKKQIESDRSKLSDQKKA